MVNISIKNLSQDKQEITMTPSIRNKTK